MKTRNFKIGVIGAGAMGSGIAQVAVAPGHEVIIFDTNKSALDKSAASLKAILEKLENKGRLTEKAIDIFNRFSFVDKLELFSSCQLVIEAIVENLDIKKSVFKNLEAIVPEDCILASNTSSLSITAIASACKRPERVLGIHFFNPAPLMPLVEIVPALQTDIRLPGQVKTMLLDWKKSPVIAKDTPGFIVNRIARPFYSEALRIYEEGIADMATIDWAMTEIGGFRMGPFTLMDYIGHDVNYVVTETVFKSFFFDPRYKPSLSQQRLLDAGWLGRKSGRGFYDYAKSVPMPEATKNEATGREIVKRIILMLVNEAVDALYLNIASATDIETAMTKGVNYPKGLLQWCEELGIEEVLNGLDGLYNTYHEDRYRASALFRKWQAEGKKKIL
ncbi:MAG TPA: 3-hydroxyacyl-CoA dehydrogenase NAD-binding domain-containing protein [Edaphocola sp.]|nr:3-hydroxyacyl-CoA dehydrogenase NAD-binding domain-containing protein [Edaphocola sp.]